MEVWKKIEGFENYEVSNYGNVKRLKCTIIYKNGNICNYNEKIIKHELNRRMYQRVTLSKNGVTKRFQVHRLVAQYFLENKENKPCVNHIDGNGLNNNVNNLEWCTYSENEKHSYDVLNKKNAIRKLTENDVRFIRFNGITGKKGNIKYLAHNFNVNISTIYNILKNKYYVKVT